LFAVIAIPLGCANVRSVAKHAQARDNQHTGRFFVIYRMKSLSELMVESFVGYIEPWDCLTHRVVKDFNVTTTTTPARRVVYFVTGATGRYHRG